METIYLTPGPSQLYPTVKKHIVQALQEDIPSLSHRSDRFREIVSSIRQNLKELLSVPEDYSVFFTSSATEAMERIIENTVEKKSFHLVDGIFSEHFYDIARDLKKQPEILRTPLGRGFGFGTIQLPEDTELLCVTHTETSTGVTLTLEEVYTLAARTPDALVALDVVASVPYAQIDFRRLDCVFFSVQKGFGLPAGLGVLIVSPRALRKAEQLEKREFNVGSYHKFSTLYREAQLSQTYETPNVLGIYLLDAVLKDFLDRGLQNIREETDSKAELLYSYFEKEDTYKPFVEDKNLRAKTVIVLGTPSGSAAVITHLRRHGFVVGAGYGSLKEQQMRIANFPAHTMENMKNLLNTVKMMK